MRKSWKFPPLCLGVALGIQGFALGLEGETGLVPDREPAPAALGQLPVLLRGHRQPQDGPLLQLKAGKILVLRTAAGPLSGADALVQYHSGHRPDRLNRRLAHAGDPCFFVRAEQAAKQDMKPEINPYKAGKSRDLDDEFQSIAPRPCQHLIGDVREQPVQQLEQRR